MPMGVMIELGMWVDNTYGKHYAMNKRSIPVIGLMKDVELNLVSFLEVVYKV